MVAHLTFEQIKLYGFHGLYPEEANIGCWFKLTIKARLKTNFKLEEPNLSNSLDYELLYNQVKKIFNKREHLIESVALNIYNALGSEFSQVDKWEISIEKQNPLGVANFNPCFCISDF